MKEKELLEKYQSPIYVYDEEMLENRITNMLDFSKNLKQELNIPVIKMHYSTKANGNLSILKKVKTLGMAVETMSPVELKLAELAGFNKEDILYVCNNVKIDELMQVTHKDILLCLDSVSQVELLGKNRPGSKIMVRINSRGNWYRTFRKSNNFWKRN
jgi:diaminopimelate decarboxylase